MNRLAVAALCSIAAFAPPAMAQAGWYAGFSAGQSRTSRDLVANRESTITLATDFDSDFDDKDRVLKATLGYRVHRLVAVEVNYADLGEHRVFSSFLGGDAPAPAAIDLKREVTGTGVDAVLFAPIGRGSGMFARVGVVRTRLKASQGLDGNVVFTGGDPAERVRSTVRHETVRRYGVGFEFAIDARAWVRIEWERYAKIGKAFEVGGSGTTGEADTDALLAGLMFRF